MHVHLEDSIKIFFKVLLWRCWLDLIGFGWFWFFIV